MPDASSPTVSAGIRANNGTHHRTGPSGGAHQSVVAVTGAGGFIGGAVAADLEAAGHRVVRLARRPIAGIPGGVGEGIVGEDVVAWDLRRDYAGAMPLPRVNTVVHCAASLATFDADHTLRAANVDGTRRVLEAWPGVPLVFISSASVYPPGQGGHAWREEEATGEGLHDAYSRSKLEAERVLVDDSVASGRALTILRPSIVYGPGDRTILPSLRRLRIGRLALIPGGRSRWSMTPIGLVCDVVRAAVVSMSAEGPTSGTSGANLRVVNVAEDPPERVRDLFRRLLEEDAGRSLRVVPIPVWLMRAYAAVVEAVWRVFRIKRAPVVTRSAVAYISEERLLDLTGMRDLLAR